MPGKEQSQTAVAVEPVWKWSALGDETMHPFWAVRRMTSPQLALARAQTKAGETPPRFNCEITTKQVSSVNVGSFGAAVVNRTRLMDVPFLTNSHPLQQNEEFILEIEPKRKEEPKGNKRATSRDMLKHEEKQKKPKID